MIGRQTRKRMGSMTALRALVVLLALVAVGFAGFWAGQVALEPPEDPLAAEVEPTTYLVQVGSVGRTLTFSAVAEWDLIPAGQNSAGGVVTSIEIEPGDTVDRGDLLYTVDLRPVTVARGEVPMFRTLSQRVTGPDVAQLQQLLADLGHYEGEIDGSFGVSTRTAVRAWQDALDITVDGVVQAGDLIFVPELPVRIALAEFVTIGARLSGGEPVVQVVPSDPDFRIPLASGQAALVPLSADVFVTYPEGVWEARVEAAVEQVESGQLDLFLSGADGDSVCGDKCARWVQLTGRTVFRVEIVVIPETTGPVVPVGAISSGAGNEASVTLTDGTSVPVTVLESANGLAVVDGIDAGTEILLRAREP